MIIYGLKDPGSGEIRYIGKAKDATRRLKTHVSESERRHRPINNWVSKLVRSGNLPVMVVIKETNAANWEKDERDEIAKHRLACDLLNLADGGAGPSMSPKQRAKNGIKAAKTRDKTWWTLTRDMAQTLRWLRMNGHTEKADTVTRRLVELAKTCQPRYQRSILKLVAGQRHTHQETSRKSLLA